MASSGLAREPLYMSKLLIWFLGYEDEPVHWTHQLRYYNVMYIHTCTVARLYR